jgi:NAD(P)-dependent dehydrogenase (short-subunit alcohol dehydrogenase family)
MTNTIVQALSGQTVMVLGGSAGIGFETARQARAAGANVILTGRNPERLKRAALELQAEVTAAFDATDSAALKAFFESLRTPVDQVMVTAGTPHYGPILGLSTEEVKSALTRAPSLAVEVSRLAIGRVRAGGSLIFVSGTNRRPRPELGVVSMNAAAFPTLVGSLALELAPIRVNLIAAGFVDTDLSAALLGAKLDERREELRSTLPIRRVVKASDVAALAVHLMANTALTGATYDIDGGQQLLA